MAEFNLRNAQLYAAQTTPVVANVRNMPIYAAVQSPPVLEVRSTPAYLLYTANPEVTVRNVTAYALYAPVAVSYLKMKGSVALLTAINKEHGKSITAAQVTFGNPTPLANNQFNTTVAMTAAEDWKYSGDMVFRYDRYPLEYLFIGQQLNLPAGNQTTIHARLPGINAAFGCNLETRDVVNGPVAANATGFVLTVANTSHLFLPGTTVTLGTSLPANDLSIKAPVTDLGGFDSEG